MTAPSLTLKRKFNASPAKLFAAWTNPALLARWMGPPEIVDVIADCDPRIGGAYRFILRAARRMR